MTDALSIVKPRPKGPLPLTVLTALAVFSFGVSAHATNIVADSGFEAASGGNVYFAGQSLDAGSWNVVKGAVYVDSLDPYVFNGNNSLNLTYANLYAINAVSQALSTVVGQIYLVNFWANADTPNTFAVTENGIALTGSPNSIVNNGFPGNTTNSALFTDYFGSFVATSNTTTLSLAATGNPTIGSDAGSVMIDDLSVQVAPVPEPGSIALVLTGLVGLGQAVRRKCEYAASGTLSE